MDDDSPIQNIWDEIDPTDYEWNALLPVSERNRKIVADESDVPSAFKGMLSYRRSLTGSFESVWSELKGEVQEIIDADAPLMLRMFRAQSDKSLPAITAVLTNISLKEDGEVRSVPRHTRVSPAPDTRIDYRR